MVAIRHIAIVGIPFGARPSAHRSSRWIATADLPVTDSGTVSGFSATEWSLYGLSPERRAGSAV